MDSGMKFSVCTPSGGLAQLARAPALQAGGQRFESVILHSGCENADRHSQSAKIRDNRRSLTCCDKQDCREQQIMTLRAAMPVDAGLVPRHAEGMRCINSQEYEPLPGSAVHRVCFAAAYMGEGPAKKKRAHGGCLGSRRRRRT